MKSSELRGKQDTLHVAGNVWIHDACLFTWHIGRSFMNRRNERFVRDFTSPATSTIGGRFVGRSGVAEVALSLAMVVWHVQAVVPDAQ